MKHLKAFLLLKDWRKQYYQEKGKMPSPFLSKTFLGFTSLTIVGLLAVWGIDMGDRLENLLPVLILVAYFLLMFIKGIIDRCRRGKSFAEAMQESLEEVVDVAKDVNGASGKAAPAGSADKRDEAQSQPYTGSSQ